MQKGGALMPESRDQDKDRELAYFRFGLIAPIIQGNYPDASLIAYCRRVTEHPLTRPDGTIFQYKPKTIEKWVSQYKSGGMDALLPQSRSDKGSARALSDECIAEIYRIRERFPRLDAVQIRLRLIQDGLLKASVSPRTIQRFLKVNHVNLQSASPTSKQRMAFEEPFFGSMWQDDTSYFPYIPDDSGKLQRTFLMLIVDDHSRFIVGARFFFADNAYNFQKLLKDAVATYGIPHKLYTDHGAAYENSQLAFICGSVGIHLIHAPVRDGASKGKVERAFRVLRSRWLDGLDTKQIRSLQEFDIELTEAVRLHNLTINSNTKQTPMERYLASRNRISEPTSRNWLDEAFMNRIRRRVRSDSTISVQNVQLDVPMQFINQTVDVRFLPDAIHEAYILDGGIHFPLKPTDRQANSRVKRNSGPTVDYTKGVK